VFLFFLKLQPFVLLQSIFSNLADFVTGNNEIPQTDTHWFSEGGIIDIFLMLGPSPKDVFMQYAALTGTTPLPPVSSWVTLLQGVCLPFLINNNVESIT
jgi:alpha-glucosidase (family GH31 glycosyl hydrolase)